MQWTPQRDSRQHSVDRLRLFGDVNITSIASKWLRYTLFLNRKRDCILLNWEKLDEQPECSDIPESNWHEKRKQRSAAKDAEYLDFHLSAIANYNGTTVWIKKRKWNNRQQLQSYIDMYNGQSSRRNHQAKRTTSINTVQDTVRRMISLIGMKLANRIGCFYLVQWLILHWYDISYTFVLMCK